jgi:hypothetical protein
MGRRREAARAGGHHSGPGGGPPGEGDVDDWPRSAPGSRGGGLADRSRPPSSSGGDPGGRIPRSPPVGCPGEVPAEAPPPAGTSPGLPGRRHHRRRPGRGPGRRRSQHQEQQAWRLRQGGVRGPWRGGSQARAPRPEAAASSSRPSRVAPSRTPADTSSRSIRSLLSRGVAVPPDVRPWQARRPSVPGDHFPVPGTAVSFPEFVIQPIAVILPTSQTYPILREFSSVSRKKKASDPPIPIFSQTS